jgi:hypothetical protein
MSKKTKKKYHAKPYILKKLFQKNYFFYKIKLTCIKFKKSSKIKYNTKQTIFLKKSLSKKGM